MKGINNILLFRAWDLDNKKWIACNWQFLTWEHDTKNEISYLLNNLLSSHHYEINQYTGVKDKDKKMIFTGDIIEATFDDITYKKIGSFKSEVRFGYGQYYVVDKKTDILYPIYDIWAHCKVIGNIYENLELLE